MTHPAPPMRKGNRADRLDRLQRALSVQTVSRSTADMTAWIIAEAEKIGASWSEHDGNVYVTKGTAGLYPCYVAHTDTVHRIIKDFSVHRIGDALFGWDGERMAMSGVGGDDKVGVWLALQMLEELEYGKAAFFRDEEVGCLGARQADLSFFDDCAFILQGDRRGWKDVVVRASGEDLCSADFVMNISPIVKKYGRELCYTGMMTDVEELSGRNVGISTINASCGYYRPHDDEEVVVIPDAIQTLDFFRAVTKAMGHKRWEHVSRHTSSWNRWDYDDYDKWDGWKPGTIWDYQTQSWVQKTTPISAPQKRPASDRWGFAEKASESAHETRLKIMTTIANGHMAGKTIKYPGYVGVDRTDLDDLVESVGCPECGEVAMMVDRLNRDQTTDDELDAFCWSCGTIGWTAFEIAYLALEQSEHTWKEDDQLPPEPPEPPAEETTGTLIDAEGTWTWTLTSRGSRIYKKVDEAGRITHIKPEGAMLPEVTDGTGR